MKPSHSSVSYLKIIEDGLHLLCLFCLPSSQPDDSLFWFLIFVWFDTSKDIQSLESISNFSLPRSSKRATNHSPRINIWLNSDSIYNIQSQHSLYWIRFLNFPDIDFNFYIRVLQDCYSKTFLCLLSHVTDQIWKRESQNSSLSQSWLWQN